MGQVVEPLKCTQTIMAPPPVTVCTEGIAQPPLTVVSEPVAEPLTTVCTQYVAEPLMPNVEDGVQQCNLFDMIYRNHDGVITRCELAAAVNQGQTEQPWMGAY